MHMVRGFMLSQALHVGAKLAVFDALCDGPKTTREIAEALRANEPALHRLLRFLTAVGVLHEDEAGRFACTPLGDLLRSDHPQSARALAVMYGEPMWWKAWGDLFHTLKSGRPGFDSAHGATLFDYLDRHAGDAAIFNAAMTSASNVDLLSILSAYDFSGFARIVDVAGGHGALLRGILERCPNVTGVLCDLPSVLSGARAPVQAGVASRYKMCTANMFESVPPGGDAYILKRIVHDWSDAEAVQLLTNVRRAILAGGKLLAMEAVVKSPNQPDPAKWMDLNMLAMLSGRERTEAEYGELYAAAGFRLARVVPAGAVSIIEGVPI